MLNLLTSAAIAIILLHGGGADRYPAINRQKPAATERAGQVNDERCGRLDLFKEEPWYPRVLDAFGDVTGQSDDYNATAEACIDDHRDTLVVLRRGGLCKASYAYGARLSTARVTLGAIPVDNKGFFASQQADAECFSDMDRSGMFVSPLEMHAQADGSLLLTGQVGGGGCMLEARYRYDAAKHRIELTETSSHCEEEFGVPDERKRW
jgi:hypothetical protein